MGAVTVTRSRPGTFDATTRTWTSPTSTTITGSAFQKRSNPQRYAALGLNLSTMPTLFFTPDDYELMAYTTEFVLPGDSVDWNDLTFKVEAVDPIAPDGFVIAANLIVSAVPGVSSAV